MAWSSQQNPGGYSQPAVRPIQDDVLYMTTSANEARKILIARMHARIASGRYELPISASARKTDGFAPVATSTVI